MSSPLEAILVFYLNKFRFDDLQESTFIYYINALSIFLYVISGFCALASFDLAIDTEQSSLNQFIGLSILFSGSLGVSYSVYLLHKTEILKLLTETDDPNSMSWIYSDPFWRPL